MAPFQKVFYYLLPQLVAIETMQKGQAIWKFIKDFYNTPSLIQGNSESLWATKMRTVYKLFTTNTSTISAVQSVFAQPIRTTIYELFTGILSTELFT